MVGLTKNLRNIFLTRQFNCYKWQRERDTLLFVSLLSRKHIEGRQASRCSNLLSRSVNKLTWLSPIVIKASISMYNVLIQIQIHWRKYTWIVNMYMYSSKAVTRVSFLVRQGVLRPLFPSRSRTGIYGVHEAPALFEIARVFFLRKWSYTCN